MNHCVCCMCILDLSDAIFLAIKGSFGSVKLTRVENYQHYLFQRVDRISVLFNLKTKQRKLFFSFQANYKLFGKLSKS